MRPHAPYDCTGHLHASHVLALVAHRAAQRFQGVTVRSAGLQHLSRITTGRPRTVSGGVAFVWFSI